MLQHMIKNFKEKKHKCLYNALLKKYNRNTRVNYSPFFLQWLCGLSWYLLPILHFLHPWQALQQLLALFLEERPMPLFLMGLLTLCHPAWISYCSFPMSLITGHGSNKRHSKRSPVLQTQFFLPLL